MAISFLLLGGAAFFVFALIVLLVVIGFVTKRPGAVAIVGLVCLLGIGGVLGSLLFVRSSARMEVYNDGTAMMSQGINTYPPVMMQSPQGMQVRTRWSFAFMPIMLLGVLAVTGIVALVVRASNSGGRRPIWPMLVAVPVIGLLLLVFFGYMAIGTTTEFGGVPHLEHLPQHMEHHGTAFHADPMAIQGQMVDHARTQALHAEEAKRSFDMASADAKTRRDLAVTETRRQREKAIQEQLRQRATHQLSVLNARLQYQLATMDINELIDVFTAPKINLGPVLMEVATNTAQPVPAIDSEPKTIEVLPAIAPPAAAIAPASPTAPAAVAVAAASAGGGDGSTKALAEATDSVIENLTAAQAASEKTAPTAELKHAKVTIEKAPTGKAVEKAVASADATGVPKKTEMMPSWINDQPGMNGQDWREIVSTDEYSTEDEARRAMDILLMLKTAERVRSQRGQQFVEHRRPSVSFYQGVVQLDGHIVYDPGYSKQWTDEDLRLLSSMGIGMNEIRRSVVREQYMAERESPRALNTMYKQYTQAQFTPWFDDQLKKHWLAYKRQEQFMQVGVGASSVLGLLAVVFGLLKVDTWTKGYYTKRLFIGVPAMIIGGFLLIVFIDAAM